MCGIYALLSVYLRNAAEAQRRAALDLVKQYHKRLGHRGPDAELSLDVNDYLYMAFYRLAINGVAHGMQPFNLPEYPHIFMMCNGEIYNHVELQQQIGYTSTTGSDCEIIIPLFARFGFESMCQLLDGVYAIVLWDENQQTLWIGRDRFGVRPLYFCPEAAMPGGEIQAVQVASELKAICLDRHFEDALGIESAGKDLKAHQLKPGSYRCYQYQPEFGKIVLAKDERFFVHSWAQHPSMTLYEALSGINRLFRRAVVKRLMSERPIGCLLSGGLDSSLVAAIVAEAMHKLGKQIHTFSIGMSESTDVRFAREVARHIGSIHHEFVLTPEEFLAHIDEVVYVIESWDTTSVRASVGNYLVCKKIAEYNRSVKPGDQAIVIFNGDGSDELAGGYLYHRKAPTDLEFHLEAQRLLSELYMYDVLRSDRTISDNGLEPRTPFLDKDFVNFYMGIPLDLRADRKHMEKWLIREAFRYDGLLPEAVLFRTKEAFSDGVSGTTKSWWQMIHEWVEDKVNDAELDAAKGRFAHAVTTASKEALYFMKTFLHYYPHQEHIIDHYWLPKWSGNVTNPSARVLDGYNQQAQQLKPLDAGLAA